MPTAYFRTKLKQGISREKYDAWVKDFVYEKVKAIPSVVNHHIFRIQDWVFGNGPLPYDNIEVIEFSNLDQYRNDLRTNPAAAAIAQDMPTYVDVLDSVWGDVIPRDSDNKGEASMKMTWRTGQHVVQFQPYEVPNKPGHIVGAGVSGGLAFFKQSVPPLVDKDEVALLAMAFTIDMTEGTGTHVLYITLTFTDGASFTIIEEGTTTASDDKQTALFDGTVRIIDGSGTGKFKNISGEGTMTGKRFAPLGMNADTYLDYDLIFALPQQ